MATALLFNSGHCSMAVAGRAHAVFACHLRRKRHSVSPSSHPVHRSPRARAGGAVDPPTAGASSAPNHPAHGRPFLSPHASAILPRASLWGIYLASPASPVCFVLPPSSVIPESGGRRLLGGSLDLDRPCGVLRHYVEHLGFVGYWGLLAFLEPCTARNSYLKDAMNIFRKLVNSGLVPDGFSFSSVLSACAQAGARCYALVDMYAKCGRIDVAIGIFKTIKRNHVSIWNTMIGGLAAHGLGSDAVMFFREMESEGQVPDGVTFIALLTACSHCGMVEEARQYFEAMTTKYSITPKIEHYGAMVDTLSRAGLLDEAHDLVKSMNVKPDAVIWRALLSACCRYRQTKLGEITVKEIVCQGSGDYTLLSNIYSSANRWEDSEEVWKERKKKRIRKIKGLSWVELGGSTHEFKAGDRSHPDTD
ncbi:hypothetical protein E2562_014459, partial [Oryza meyeriana var. granulata]